MAEIGPIFEEMIRGRAVACTSQIPMYSTVLGRALTQSDKLDSRYWRNNLEGPVLFSTTVQAALHGWQNKSVCFVEVGPHSPLSGPLRQIFQAAKHKPTPLYVPTLRKNQDQSTNIVQSAGRMFLNGIKVSLSALNGRGTVLSDLPPYPWDYSARSWMESRITKGWRMRQHAHHELLGSRVLESTDLEPSWRNILRLEDSQWLCDHKFSGCIVYPSAGHIAAVGEAIRQITGETRYVIRNLFIKNALILDAQDEVELFTTLRPVTLTDVLDSEWFQFTICSYNGIEWRKHCAGQITTAHCPVPAGEPATALLRHVDSGLWYRSLRDLGLDYGPYFQGLANVTADPVSRVSSGIIRTTMPLEQIESYAVHPTVIDKALQLITVAAVRGIARQMDRVAIPISIDRVYCGLGHSNELSAQATCRSTANGSFTGDSIAVGPTEVILDIQGVKAFGMDAETHGDGPDDGLSSARIEWQPDIEFVSSLTNFLPPAPPRMERALHLLEQTCTLQLMMTYRSIENITPAAPHLLKYKRWLAQRMEQIQKAEYTLVSEAQEWIGMSPEQQISLHTSLSSQLEDICPSNDLLFMNRFSQRIVRSVEDIFRGNASTVEVIMADNGLEEFYNALSYPSDYKPFLSSLGHSRPLMRVLEIGAGTGGMTASTLQGLETANGVRMFSEYVFTDISQGFFTAGRERFKNVPGITFKTLDISQDPITQGFGEASFDLIVCSNVLHATPSLQATLSHVRRLLVPGGYLFLQELCPNTSLVDSIMGLLEGWWVGEGDGRKDQPYVSPTRWDEELRMAGFTGAEAVACDNQAPYQFNANIISRVPVDKPTGECVSFLHEGVITDSARLIEQAFVEQGYRVSWCSLASPSGENIVSLLDLDRPFFDKISEDSFTLFQDFISRAAPTSIMWVTKSIQMQCDDPRWSQCLAIARSIRLELSIPFATVEMNAVQPSTSKCVAQVYQKIQSALVSGLEPDYEYSVWDDSVYTSRYYHTDLSARVATLGCTTKAKRLEIGTTGLLDSLHWVQDETSDPGPGELEVDVRYGALNFKDMMVAMGFLGQKDDLGCEATGIVRKVGPGPHSQDFQVGDRIFVFRSSAFRTSFVAKSIQCCKVPPELSLEDAVTLPCVYATAVYALVTIGQVARGQSVLIHSACGGVGLAAIQVCRMLGAEIFATVGSDIKAQYLVDHHQIPRCRIFNSRSTSFKDDVMRETAGQGVDLVLNSLSGECLHASWECVAEFGKMVEIGKRDMIGHGTLNMDPFLGNRSFFGVDLHQMALQKPAELSRVLREVIHYVQQGQLTPIKPKTIFEAEEAQAAFKYMQTGQHMGKIILRFPEDPAQLPLSTAEAPLSLLPGVSYLLIGGLGGLGRAVSRWMVEQGARSLVFLSRSGSRFAGFDPFRAELNAMGCSITVVAGDVSNSDDVKRALGACPHPVAGVIQMAMVLRDQTFEKMTHDEWAGAISPKVQGTWNLYHALHDLKLDFFVVFGSLVGRFANIGQANYGAANCFLDAFTKFTRARGFPAAVLDLGAMKDVGYVSENPDILERCAKAGIQPLGERQLVRALHAAIAQARAPDTVDQDDDLSSVIIGLLPLATEHQRATYQSDLRLALFSQGDTRCENGESSQTDALYQFLVNAERDPAILDLQSSLDFLTLEIARLVRAGSEDEESIEAAAEILVDSLMSIEIRSWLRKRLNIDVPTIKIAKAKNIGGLSKLIIEELSEKLRPKDALPAERE
ncbi:KR-domain-containing protein [Aspergillus bertholletiae]|uniref:KR-domain-containing protein n=1 Tax=Aspergillus bertholletiae TaxID=1226010 RepID=A0A5N7BIL3_9EURO|nr:KR-domain-containing protein [Aspergillus bertholletiae]